MWTIKNRLSDGDKSLVAVGFRYDYDLHEHVNVFGRLGLAIWELDKASDNSNLSERGAEPLYELGVSYTLSSNVSVQASYQFIEGVGNTTSGQYDSESVVFGIQYKFKWDEQ